MKFNEGFLSVCVRFVIVCGFVLVHDRSIHGADIHWNGMKAERILFLGNSMTVHGVNASLSWYGEWGMAASAMDKDYVHVLTESVADATGITPSMKASNISTFESTYNTYNLSANLASELAFDADVAVIAIGENVPTLSNETDKANFKNAFTNLLTTVKGSGVDNIFVRSCFWANLAANTAKDSIMKEVCTNLGDTYIDISSLCKNSKNYAYADPSSQYYGIISGPLSGVSAHPGDIGMAAMADAIFVGMAAMPTPEPGTWTMLVSGVLGVGLYLWRTMGSNRDR